MELSPSAHIDTFCRDNLPPEGEWPDLEYTLAQLHYPDRLNAADELLNPVIAAGGAGRRCLLSPVETWTYGEVAARASQIASVLSENLGIVPGNRVLLRGPNNPWLGSLLARRTQGRGGRGDDDADAARDRDQQDLRHLQGEPGPV